MVMRDGGGTEAQPVEDLQAETWMGLETSHWEGTFWARGLGKEGRTTGGVEPSSLTCDRIGT